MQTRFGTCGLRQNANHGGFPGILDFPKQIGLPEGMFGCGLFAVCCVRCVCGPSQ